MNCLILILFVFSFGFWYALVRRILFPSVLISGIFTFSLLILFLNTSKWSFNLSYQTAIFLFVSVNTLSLSMYFGYKIKSDKEIKRTNGDLSISLNKSIFFNLICVIVTFGFFIHQFNLARTNGASSLLQVVGVLRNLNDDSNQSVGIVLNIGISFLRAYSIVCLFIYISKKVNKKMISWRYLVPILCSVFYYIMTTGRGQFIYLLLAIVFDLYIILKGRYSFGSNKKFIKYLIIAFCIFIGIFWGLGFLTNKSQVTSIWDSFSIYFASGLKNLDIIILNVVNSSEEPAFSSRFVFHGLYNILILLGFTIKKDIYPNFGIGEMHWWKGGAHGSNIYSAFAPYIVDYGIVITILFQIMIGLLIGYLWRKIEKGTASLVLKITYGKFIGNAIVYYPIAERICGEYFAINVIVEFVFYYILVEFFIKLTSD